MIYLKKTKNKINFFWLGWDECNADPTLRNSAPESSKFGRWQRSTQAEYIHSYRTVYQQYAHYFHYVYYIFGKRFCVCLCISSDSIKINQTLDVFEIT